MYGYFNNVYYNCNHNCSVLVWYLVFVISKVVYILNIQL